MKFTAEELLVLSSFKIKPDPVSLDYLNNVILIV